MLRMILSRAATHVAIAATSALVLASCGGSADDAPPAELLATTSIWADITSEVLCGAEVVSLIPSGADPHSFEPSLRDREAIDNARLIVSNGGRLEEGLDELVAANSGAEMVDVVAWVGTTDDDPHLWQDPTRVIAAIDAISAAAAALDLDECADDYRTELEQLDRSIATTLAGIPDRRRMLVTSHDSLAYFAARYDFEIIGTVIPSTNTLAQTNAADLALLADLITERGVRAIFTEELQSTTDAQALAERLDVAVVPLVTDALTDEPTGDSYIAMMRSNATAIGEALAP